MRKRNFRFKTKSQFISIQSSTKRNQKLYKLPRLLISMQKRSIEANRNKPRCQNLIFFPLDPRPLRFQDWRTESLNFEGTVFCLLWSFSSFCNPTPLTIDFLIVKAPLPSILSTAITKRSRPWQRELELVEGRKRAWVVNGIDWFWLGFWELGFDGLDIIWEIEVDDGVENEKRGLVLYYFVRGIYGIRL